ncbi:MAG: hypothetical protein ABSH02_09735 [Candidatus Sulfotelmatobacter sp.]
MSSTTAGPGIRQLTQANTFRACYVGAGAMLSGPQLYDLPFQHYWRSSSIVPSIPTRGYQLLQLLASISIGGVQIDLDFTQNDNQGGRSQWLRVSGSS